MFSINLSKREKSIFIITAVLIAAALLFNFLLEPGIEKFRTANNEIAVKKAVIKKYAGLLEKKDLITAEYSRYAGSDKDISQVLNYLENLAGSLRVRTRNIKPGQVFESVLYNEYKLELEVEGEPEYIIKFLSEIARFPALIVLKKFDLKLFSQDPLMFKGTIILSKILI